MKLKLMLIAFLTTTSISLHAEEVKFIDKNGENIICKINISGEKDCKNEKKEAVICGNDENSNYICSSH